MFHKSDPVDNLNNWRHISILSAFSKIFEKLMHIRMLKAIYKFSLLFPHQLGFEHSSTNTAILIDTVYTILPYKAKRMYLSERLKIFILRKTKKCILVCF